MKIQTLRYAGINKNAWFLIVASAITILFSLSPLEHSFPFLIISAGLMLGIVLILLHSPDEFNSIFFLFTAGFLIRILVSAFLFFISIMLEKQEGFFFGDGCNYSLNGWNISQLWIRGIHVTKSIFSSEYMSESGAIGNYDFFNGIIYSIISGYSPFSLFFLNCLAGSLSIILIFIMIKRIFNKDVALLSGAFCAFWPSFILWSSQNLKDPLINLSILCFLYFLIGLRHNLKFSTLLFLCFSVIILYYLQPMALVPLALALVYFLFYFRFKKGIKLALIIFLTITVLILVKQHFVNYFRSDLLELINAERQARAYERLAYFPNFDISSPGGFLGFLPLGLLAVWFSPFPWQLFSLNQMFAAPETLVWYLLLPFGIKGIYIAIKNKAKDSYLLIATILIFSIFLAVYEGNLGTLYRHKAIIVILGFIFISLGLRSGHRISSLCKSHYLT